jgi:hypothetical protein
MDGTGHRDMQLFVFLGKLDNQAKFWQRAKFWQPGKTNIGTNT